MIKVKQNLIKKLSIIFPDKNKDQLDKLADTTMLRSQNSGRCGEDAKGRYFATNKPGDLPASVPQMSSTGEVGFVQQTNPSGFTSEFTGLQFDFNRAIIQLSKLFSEAMNDTGAIDLNQSQPYPP